MGLIEYHVDCIDYCTVEEDRHGERSETTMACNLRFADDFF